MPRLKWLFLSEETVKQMRWHNEGKYDSEDSDILSHLADGEAWLALDHFDLEFAGDQRSVRLSLTSNGFQPHSTDVISTWKVDMMSTWKVRRMMMSFMSIKNKSKNTKIPQHLTG
jgi:hypothetical protein